MRRSSPIVLGAVLTALLAVTTVLPAFAGVDYAILVDNTGTMRYRERGAMTLVAINRFVDAMEPGDRVSIFSYGEVPRPVLSSYPIEIRGDQTKAAVRQQLAFTFDADRTDITAGVDLVWRERERVFPSHFDGSGGALLVLVTDGKLIPVYGDYSEYQTVYSASRSRLRELARAFGEEGIPIETVGVGTAQKVDPEHLKSIADWSGGTSHHVASAEELPDTFARIWAETRPRIASAAEAEQPGAPQHFQITESASAQERPAQPRHNGNVHTSFTITPFDMACRAATGAVALFLGLVIIGTRRRQPWAEFFTRSIGPQEQRVRGYLKPIDSPGTQMARAIIGIENPGLPTLEVGSGTPYANYAKDTLVEFVGTQDGTPPVLRVLRGEVTVDGEPVSEEWKLRDGQVVSFEGFQYMYLRGSRR